MAKRKYNLNPKQKKFADEYIITADAGHSMIAAGYTPHYAAQNASRLLGSPKVRAYIKERQLQLDKPTIAKQEEVLEYLTDVMRGKRKDEVLKGVGMGEQVIDQIRVPTKEQIRAAELLGKRYGMWTDKLEINGEVGLVKIVDDIDADS